MKRPPARTLSLLIVVGICAVSILSTLLWRADRMPLPSLRVEVLNGSGIAGLGARSAARLRALGQDVVRVGDADPSHQPRTVLLDRGGHPRWSARLAAELGDIPVLLEALENTDVDVTLILGTDAPKRLGEPL